MTVETESKKVTVAEFGKTVCGGLMGVNIACLLTILASSMTAPLADRSMFLFVGSLALLMPHVLISHANAWEKHSVSRVMGLLPIIGATLCGLGLCMLIESHKEGTGWFLGLSSPVVFFIYVQAEDRAKRKTKRAAP